MFLTVRTFSFQGIEVQKFYNKLYQFAVFGFKKAENAHEDLTHLM